MTDIFKVRGKSISQDLAIVKACSLSLEVCIIRWFWWSVFWYSRSWCDASVPLDWDYVLNGCGRWLNRRNQPQQLMTSWTLQIDTVHRHTVRHLTPNPPYRWSGKYSPSYRRGYESTTTPWSPSGQIWCRPGMHSLVSCQNLIETVHDFLFQDWLFSK